MGLVKYRYFFSLLGIIVLLKDGEGNIFSAQPKSQLVPEGSTANVMFECGAGDEIENPTYEWRKDKQILNIEGRLQLLVGNLLISQPQDGDEGSYQCVIKSNQGVAGSNMAKFEFEYLREYPTTGSEPESTIESKGVVLECGDVEYKPDYSVYFTWEETASFQRLGPTGDENMYISQNSGNLYLSNPKPSDSGSYQCTARARWDVNGKFARTEAKTIDLKVSASTASYKPTFLLTPTDVTYVELYAKTFIECFATGNPTPTNSWTFNGGPLPEGAEVTAAGQLLFNSVKEGMEGTYTCTAENEQGSESTSGNLILQYPPVWDEVITSVSADLTASVSFTCSAKAVPTATYDWWKDGSSLVEEDNSSVVITYDEGFTMLAINNLEEKHAGIYQCVAKNKFGNAVSSALLEVNSYAPDIEDLPTLTSAALGEPITIPCKHTAAPAATISWSKDGAAVSGDRYKMSDDGALTITDVDETDEGTYSCTAQNMLGSDSSQGSLKAYTGTDITTFPKDVHLVAGSSAEMSCSASHDPALTLRWHWYHDDTELLPILDAAYFIEAGQLTIKAATSAEGGTYRCCAETDVGTPCGIADVVVTAPPNEPTGITVKGATSDSHLLSWEEPFDNYSPITSYTIEVKDSYNEEWLEADTEPSNINTTSCKVIGLYPYNDYNYRIYAHNDLGSSEASDPSPAFATSKGAPKKAPTRVGGGGGELGELLVTWEPLPEEYFGAEHIDYVVAIRRRTEPLVGIPLIILPPNNNTTAPQDPQEGPWTEMTILDEKRSNCTFTVNMTEIYVPYEVKIRADNELGEGPWSVPRIVRTAELSPVEAPTGIKLKEAQAHVAIFTWDILTSENGFIKGYFVKVEPKAGESTGTHMKQTLTALPRISVDELSPNTVYYVTICGFNSAGQGPWSEPLIFNTAKKPPSRAPEDVKVSIKGTVVSASWKPITDMSLDEAILLGYKVQYWWSNKTTDTAVTHRTTATSMNFQVPNNSLLNVWVRGYSSGGDGNPSTIYYVSSQSTSKDGYISCCGAETITFNSSMIIFITMLWFLFVKLDV